MVLCFFFFPPQVFPPLSGLLRQCFIAGPASLVTCGSGDLELWSFRLNLPSADLTALVYQVLGITPGLCTCEASHISSPHKSLHIHLKEQVASKTCLPMSQHFIPFAVGTSLTPTGAGEKIYTSIWNGRTRGFFVLGNWMASTFEMCGTGSRQNEHTEQEDPYWHQSESLQHHKKYIDAQVAFGGQSFQCVSVKCLP